MSIFTYVKSWLSGTITKGIMAFVPMSGRDAPDPNLTELMSSYKKNVYVYSCISAIAEDVAEVDIKLQKLIKGEWVDVPDHDVLRLFHNPNPYLTKYTYVEMVQSYLESVGQMFTVVLRTKGGKPAELWPLRPDRVTILFARAEDEGKSLPNKTGDIITGYEYQLDSGSKVTFPADDVIFNRFFNPDSPYRGMGSIKPASTAIDNEKYSGLWQLYMFKNMGQPGVVLKYKGNITPEQKKEIESDWRARISEFQNAGMPLVLAGGLEAEKLGLTSKEMDYTQSRQAIRDDIMMAFRTPKTVVGITDDVNRANAEAADYVFAKRIIKPRIRRIVEDWTKFIQREYPSENLRMIFVDPVPVDQEARSVHLQRATGVPYMTPNEAREEMGLDGLGPEGDKLYLPINVIPVEIETRPEASTALKSRKADTVPVVTEGDVERVAAGVVVRSALLNVKKAEQVKKKPKPAANKSVTSTTASSRPTKKI